MMMTRMMVLVFAASVCSVASVTAPKKSPGVIGGLGQSQALAKPGVPFTGLHYQRLAHGPGMFGLLPRRETNAQSHLCATSGGTSALGALRTSCDDSH